MKIGGIKHDMNIYEVADALRLSPDSLVSAWKKRTAELRKQGRTMEADYVESKFADRFSDETKAQQDAFGKVLLKWADSL